MILEHPLHRHRQYVAQLELAIVRFLLAPLPNIGLTFVSKKFVDFCNELQFHEISVVKNVYCYDFFNNFAKNFVHLSFDWIFYHNLNNNIMSLMKRLNTINQLIFNLWSVKYKCFKDLRVESRNTFAFV